MAKKNISQRQITCKGQVIKLEKDYACLCVCVCSVCVCSVVVCVCVCVV